MSDETARFEDEVAADATADSTKVSTMDRFTDWLLRKVWGIRVWLGLEDPPYDAETTTDETEEEGEEDSETEAPADAETDDTDFEPEPDDSPEETGKRPYGTVVAWVVVILVLSVLFVCGLKSCSSLTRPGNDATTSTTGTTTATATVTTWRMAYSDYGDNSRWFTNGITAIKNAKTPAQAEEAAQVWLDQVKPDPNLLAAAISIILERDVDKSTLFDKDNWATEEAVQLVAEMRLALATASIMPDNAPTNGTNTGVSNNTVVSARTAGVSGNRKSIRITLSDGRVIWVLARCGNVVTLHKPSLPPGKTDNHVTPKDPSKDPYPRGNAPTGGGKNLDSGPGTYIPPTGMVHPPASPRINPTVPKPTAPPTGSKPDPTPAPAPEPTAPTPDAPATGYSPAPGT